MTRDRRHPGYAPPDATGHHAHDGERELHAGGDRPHSHDRSRPTPTLDPTLTDEQVETLLRRVFEGLAHSADAAAGEDRNEVDPMPEVAVVPPELLAEIGRRVRPTKPLDEEEAKATGP